MKQNMAHLMLNTIQAKQLSQLNDMLVSKSLDKMFKNLPIAFYALDRNGYCLDGNDIELKILQMRSIEELIGKHTTEISAPMAWENSKKVMESKQPLIFQEQHFTPQGDKICYISIKSPWLKNNGTVNGLYGMSIDISSISESNKTTVQQTKNYTCFNNKRFVLSGPRQNIYLTRREAQCAYFLVKGKSAKETAKILNISPKSVEYYLDQAKQKLNCHSSSKLIDILLSENIFYSLTEFLL